MGDSGAKRPPAQEASASCSESSEHEKLQDRIRILENALTCPICHSLMTAPVSLRSCGHLFCSYCLRRYLCAQSRCPLPACGKAATTTDIVALRSLDVFQNPTDEPQRRPRSPTRRKAKNDDAGASSPAEGGYLVSVAASDRAVLRDRLESAGLPSRGTVSDMSKRYREYVLRYNANLDSRTPQPPAAIASATMRWDGDLEAEKAKKARQQQGYSWKFVRKRSLDRDGCPPTSVDIAETTRKKMRTLQDHGALVQAGDSFAELIRKTRLRRQLQQTPKRASAEPTEVLEVPDSDGEIPMEIPSEPESPDDGSHSAKTLNGDAEDTSHGREPAAAGLEEPQEETSSFDGPTRDASTAPSLIPKGEPANRDDSANYLTASLSDREPAATDNDQAGREVDTRANAEAASSSKSVASMPVPVEVVPALDNQADTASPSVHDQPIPSDARESETASTAEPSLGPSDPSEPRKDRAVPSRVTTPLSPEILARIERNRQAAIARRKAFQMDPSWTK